MHHPTLPETTIEEAKNWMRDDEDKDQIDNLDDLATIRGIDRYYDGGWLQFVRDLADPHRPKTWLQFLEGVLN